MQIHLLGQERLAQIIRENLKRYGVEVEFSSELVGLEQFEDRVCARVRKPGTDSEGYVEVVEAPFVVGADGGKGMCYSTRFYRGHSLTTLDQGVVRKLLDLKFVGESQHDHALMAIGDVPILSKGMLDKEVLAPFL